MSQISWPCKWITDRTYIIWWDSANPSKIHRHSLVSASNIQPSGNSDQEELGNRCKVIRFSSDALSQCLVPCVWQISCFNEFCFHFRDYSKDRCNIDHFWWIRALARKAISADLIPSFDLKELDPDWSDYQWPLMAWVNRRLAITLIHTCVLRPLFGSFFFRPSAIWLERHENHPSCTPVSRRQ